MVSSSTMKGVGKSINVSQFNSIQNLSRHTENTATGGLQKSKNSLSQNQLRLAELQIAQEEGLSLP